MEQYKIIVERYILSNFNTADAIVSLLHHSFPTFDGPLFKMTASKSRTALLWLAFTAAFAALGYGASSGPTSRNTATIVSQKGRMFSASTLYLSIGDTIRIVNDDADLQHHAYIDSKDFRFDSGDQEPGSTTDIAFTIAGSFTVLCGIHPKMKLVVNVK